MTSIDTCVTRKLAKSTVVLIPLFGVPYIIFLSAQRVKDHRLEVVKLYFELFVSSFQVRFFLIDSC